MAYPRNTPAPSAPHAAACDPDRSPAWNRRQAGAVISLILLGATPPAEYLPQPANDARRGAPPGFRLGVPPFPASPGGRQD